MQACQQTLSQYEVHFFLLPFYPDLGATAATSHTQVMQQSHAHEQQTRFHHSTEALCTLSMTL